MKTHISLHHLLLSALTMTMVFVLAATFSSPLRAATVQTYNGNSAKPITVAWYRDRVYRPAYGPGYGYRGGYNRYNNGWIGWGRPGYRCQKRCFYDRWGNVVRCVRQ